MDPRQLLSRLSQLKAEGDAIMQQLMAAGMPPEQIMAAMEGGGQQPQIPMGVDMGVPMGGPGMGVGPGPDLPPGIPQGVPQGLLGAV